MVEFGWIKMSFLLIQVLQITVQLSSTRQLSLFVRAGGDVALSCENVIDDQDNCDGTTWLFNGPRSTAAVELIKLGQIHKDAKAKSDRLSVTANCSLVIKKVTVEDVGRYFCRRFRSGQHHDSEVHLSVVSMDQREDAGEVTLTCSVSTHGRCQHTVKWLYKVNKVIKTSGSSCLAIVTFKASRSIYTFKCNVTDSKTWKVFPFSPQSSGKATDWWWYVLVAVGLAALLIIVVAVVRWRRTKANKTQMDDNIGLTSNPAVTQSAPETSQDTADPQDGVSYASISYTREPNSKLRGKDGVHRGDAVTYSTVKAPSTNPSDLYATIN